MMISAWTLAWAFIGARLLGFRILWKTAVSVAALTVLLTAASSALSWQMAERPQAVIVQVPAAASTNGDGATAKLSLGEIVEPVQKRGDSIRVRTVSGDTLWLPAESVEVI
jgi:hypothetical protein